MLKHKLIPSIALIFGLFICTSLISAESGTVNGESSDGASATSVEDSAQEKAKESIVSAVDKEAPVIFKELLLQGENFGKASTENDALAVSTFIFRQLYLASRPEFETEYEIARLEWAIEEACVNCRNRLFKMAKGGTALPKKASSVYEALGSEGEKGVAMLALSECLTTTRSLDVDKIKSRAELLFANNNLNHTKEYRPSDNYGYIMYLAGNSWDFFLVFLESIPGSLYQKTDDGNVELIDSIENESDYRETLREVFKIEISKFGYPTLGPNSDCRTSDDWESEIYDEKRAEARELATRFLSALSKEPGNGGSSRVVLGKHSDATEEAAEAAEAVDATEAAVSVDLPSDRFFYKEIHDYIVERGSEVLTSALEDYSILQLFDRAAEADDADLSEGREDAIKALCLVYAHVYSSLRKEFDGAEEYAALELLLEESVLDAAQLMRVMVMGEAFPKEIEANEFSDLDIAMQIGFVYAVAMRLLGNYQLMVDGELGESDDFKERALAYKSYASKRQKALGAEYDNLGLHCVYLQLSDSYLRETARIAFETTYVRSKDKRVLPTRFDPKPLRFVAKGLIRTMLTSEDDIPDLDDVADLLEMGRILDKYDDERNVFRFLKQIPSLDERAE